jgi:predicted RNA binding protein YcfA (HicA-like mRNA interferase family)
MSKLPKQLTWREFVCVLEKLGYTPMKSGHGSARSFHCEFRAPSPVTFHEPHGKDRLREGTLREYIRKLGLSREDFLHLLDGC